MNSGANYLFNMADFFEDMPETLKKKLLEMQNKEKEEDYYTLFAGIAWISKYTPWHNLKIRKHWYEI